jgi:hypothetical protein
LRYGAALEMGDRDALTVRLYAFHRWPLAPKLVMALPPATELREFVLKEGPSELIRHWRSQRHDKHPGWLSWIRRDRPTRLPRVIYKLYVSPPPTLIRETLRELVPELTESRCLHFKVGATPAGLTRPDKLVAYFPSRAEVLRVGRAAKARLAGMNAHGVPFSCPIAQAGTVSWAIDPPHGNGRMSWRTWICGELAQAMTTAPASERLDAAYRRLTQLGIDSDRWKPSRRLWQTHGRD